jgi:hypothetical protein
MPTTMSDHRKGASRHGGGSLAGDVTRRYEGPMPGGRSVSPHADRGADRTRRKIQEMKREARQTPKIGSSPP